MKIVLFIQMNNSKTVSASEHSGQKHLWKTAREYEYLKTIVCITDCIIKTCNLGIIGWNMKIMRYSSKFYTNARKNTNKIIRVYRQCVKIISY